MMLDLNVCLHSPHIRKHDQADSIRDDRHTLRNISTPFYWANVYCSLRLILALGAQKPRCDREEDDDDEANNETPPGHILAHAQYHEQYRCIGTRSPCLQMYCQSEEVVAGAVMMPGSADSLTELLGRELAQICG